MKNFEDIFCTEAEKAIWKGVIDSLTEEQRNVVVKVIQKTVNETGEAVIDICVKEFKRQFILGTIFGGSLVLAGVYSVKLYKSFKEEVIDKSK